MLIINRASYNTNEKFVKVYYSKNILLFQLLPLTTYLLQLLDVMCFQLLKHYHFGAIDEIIHNENCEFWKIEFLAQIINICLQAFKKNII